MMIEWRSGSPSSRMNARAAATGTPCLFVRMAGMLGYSRKPVSRVASSGRSTSDAAAASATTASSTTGASNRWISRTSAQKRSPSAPTHAARLLVASNRRAVAAPNRRCGLIPVTIRPAAHTGSSLMRDACATKEHDDGSAHDVQVQSEALMLEVDEVVLDALGQRRRSSVLDLLVAGDSRLRLQPSTLRRGVALDQPTFFVSRTDDAH